MILCLGASGATGQTPENFRFGVGIDYSPVALPGDVQGHFETAGLTDFFVPVQIGPYIRFEAQLGLYFNNYQEQVPDSGWTFLRTTAQQIVRTGFGIIYTRPVDSSFYYGLGVRTGILSSEFETHQATTGIQDSDTHLGVFYLGGVFSVEYFISQHFSIGGELQFIYYNYGAPLVTIGSNALSGYLSPDSPSQGVWSTSEVLSARFWF